MFSLIKKIFNIKWYYLLYGSYVYVEPGSTFKHGKNISIRNAKIHLIRNSSLILGDNVRIKDTLFALSKGNIIIGNNSVFSKGEMPTKQKIIVSNGKILFGQFNRVRTQKVWIRFGGILKLGNFINLNDFTEIRCDDSITLGDYVESSYRVKIWDTNTHELEPIIERRKRWEELYLKRDVSEKPKTKPVIIGNDCWIGDSVTILKGTTVGCRCICGYGVILSNITVPDSTTIVNQIKYKTFNNGN